MNKLIRLNNIFDPLEDFDLQLFGVFFGGGRCHLGTEQLKDYHIHSEKGRQKCVVQCSELRVRVIVATGFALSVLAW